GADVYETPATNPPSAVYSQAPSIPSAPTSSGQQPPQQGYCSQLLITRALATLLRCGGSVLGVQTEG
ncbi:hypothetical protein FBEOM_12183, partial [Fusarium beomiforme]